MDTTSPNYDIIQNYEIKSKIVIDNVFLIYNYEFSSQFRLKS